MTWEEWCKEYPCIVLKRKPEQYELCCNNQPEAEICVDKLMEGEWCFKHYEAAEFEGIFYCVSSEEAHRCSI